MATVCAYLELLGSMRAVLKTDQAPAISERGIVVARMPGFAAESTAVAHSATNGLVENAIRRAAGMTRTLKSVLKSRLGDVGPYHPAEYAWWKIVTARIGFMWLRQIITNARFFVKAGHVPCANAHHWLRARIPSASAGGKRTAYLAAVPARCGDHRAAMRPLTRSHANPHSLRVSPHLWRAAQSSPEDMLGEAFTPEVEFAWAMVYGFISAIMVCRPPLPVVGSPACAMASSGIRGFGTNLG